ncbi:MAG: hypothetical protein ABSC34_11535 [Acidimicrobiales bacterium]|jgi:predicted lipoprotein with Yx(FWY)xxD motif
MTFRNRKRSSKGVPRCGVAALALLGGVATTVATATSVGASSSPTTITVSQNKTWGPTLTLKDGFTLYRLKSDGTDKTTCTAKCATVWLPVLLAKGQKTPVGDGVSKLGSFSRPGGGLQVTYEGIPLYRFFKDKKAGQVTGNIKDTWGQWWSINPADPLKAPKKIGGSTGTTTTTVGAGGGAY